MKTRRKICVLILSILLSIIPLTIPSITKGEITSYHSNNAEINLVSFRITIFSPDTDQSFSNAMYLKFTVNWTKYPTFSGFPSPPAPTLATNYTYTIDDYEPITITSNQSTTDIFGYGSGRTIVVNPTFLYYVNVSNLTNGYHKLVVTANLHSTGSITFTDSSPPVKFLVEKSTPTLTSEPSPSQTPTAMPTSKPITSPTVPELSWLAIVPLLLSVFAVAILVMHRKNANLK